MTKLSGAKIQGCHPLKIFKLKLLNAVVTLVQALYFQVAVAGAEDSYIWVSFFNFLMKMGNPKN